MNKKVVFVLVTILGVFLGGLVSYYNYEGEENSKVILEEDILSYNIQNRHDCWQIKDNQEYNNCLSFYLKNDPYKINERLVPTRLIE